MIALPGKIVGQCIVNEIDLQHQGQALDHGTQIGTHSPARRVATGQPGLHLFYKRHGVSAQKVTYGF